MVVGDVRRERNGDGRGFAVAVEGAAREGVGAFFDAVVNGGVQVKRHISGDLVFVVDAMVDFVF